MVRVFFPSMFMRLMSLNIKKTPPMAKLQVPPSMTRTEVKEYLTKIYDINVLNVDTANVQGEWKRLYGKRKVLSHKRRNFKLAYVKYDADSSFSSIKAK